MGLSNSHQSWESQSDRISILIVTGINIIASSPPISKHILLNLSPALWDPLSGVLPFSVNLQSWLVGARELTAAWHGTPDDPEINHFKSL